MIQLTVTTASSYLCYKDDFSGVVWKLGDIFLPSRILAAQVFSCTLFHCIGGLHSIKLKASLIDCICSVHTESIYETGKLSVCLWCMCETKKEFI